MFFCDVTEINPYFPTMLVAIYLIQCMMGQNIGAGRAVSSVLSHPSLCVVRVRRGPSKSNSKRSRIRPPRAFSIPVTCVYEGGKLGRRKLFFFQNVDEASWKNPDSV